MSSNPAVMALAQERADQLCWAWRPHAAYLGDVVPLRTINLAPTRIGPLMIRETGDGEAADVIVTTMTTFGRGHVASEAARRSPVGMVRRRFVFIGVYRGDHIEGLHAGFRWDDRTWIRRFWSYLPEFDDPTSLGREGLRAIEDVIYGHLDGLGVRHAFAMIIPDERFVGPRRAEGWRESHYVHLDGNDRPFLWMRKDHRA
jgi:hypothetical protein